MPVLPVAGTPSLEKVLGRLEEVRVTASSAVEWRAADNVQQNPASVFDGALQQFFAGRYTSEDVPQFDAFDPAS